MNDFKEQMKTRTRKTAVKVLQVCDKLPETTNYYVVKKQLIRCATSVGANYRAACRAKSKADFVHKLHIVEEECDESIYWLELLIDLQEDGNQEVLKLINEFNQVLSIIVTALKTAKGIQNPK